ncbi:MAG TPA: o-succinylbenzoate synthase [Bryobacteraceae bacterium]|nr:o-succinylbenzoate synthase [Bryobacteraceae bacterium]
MAMIIKNVTLTHVRVPLVEPFRISSGAVAEKDGIVVRIDTSDSTGFGESSPMAGSFYSSDTPDSCWSELRERIVPSLLQEKFSSPLAGAEWISGTGGSNFAKTGVETALWDLEARQRNMPLHRLLGGSDGPVESGLAVGLYADVGDLLRAIEKYLADGYKRVKIKIERGHDLELVRAVRGEFGNIPLFVDANGAYDMSDLPVFQALDDFGLMMFEQPFPGSMLPELAALQRQVKTPVCLDESLESENDVKQAIALGSMRIANIKVQRVGGFGPALRLYELCKNANIPVWVGTMPELGIGQVQGMAFASLPHCSFPTDVEASARWFRDDIISPWLDVKDGCLNLSPAPGLGFEVVESKLAQYAVRTETFQA